MPSSPARWTRPASASPVRRATADTPPRPPPKPSPRRIQDTPPRPPPKPSPRRTQSYSPRSPAHRAPNVRRHTMEVPRIASSPHRPSASSPRPGARRTASSPAPGSQHVLIPVPIRAQDAESPMFIRAPSGQHVDFVFSPPKKRGLIGRLLDSVEWGDPEGNKPYRYRKASPKPSGTARPFYKKLLP